MGVLFTFFFFQTQTHKNYILYKYGGIWYVDALFALNLDHGFPDMAGMHLWMASTFSHAPR